VNLSEPFIRRPVMTVLLTVSAILFGSLAYLAMPVNNLPAVDYPVITVNVAYPGATPETMANNIATPLERQFMQIPGLDLVTSNSSQSSSTFTLQFDLSKSIDAAATDVQTAITQATGQLPSDLPSPPTFSKSNPNDEPIKYIALTSSSVTRGQLYDFANTQAGERISIVPGVSRVLVYGTPSAVRIKADPSALAARGLTIDDLEKAITNSTSYQGAGQFDGPHRTFLLQPQGQLDSAEKYNKLVIAYRNNAPVYLKDVATAVDSVQDERIDLRFWYRSPETPPTATVVMAVFRQAGANVVNVSKAVEDLIPVIQKTLPASVSINTIYDRSLSIKASVIDVQTTLVIAFVLVVIVIFVFLGRATDTLIPVVALPLSLLLTFSAMRVLDYSLDNLSLMALTLAIGFLVDDAIVFLENTVRRMEKFDEAPVLAALRSAQEISFTILSMTISLAAVFLPLVLMSGLMGRIFREFSVTIIISIIASGIVSLTLTPLMCARLLSPRGSGHKLSWIERVIGSVEHRVLSLYGNSLWFFLRHKWVSALVWIICLAGTIELFRIVPKSFLPVGDSSTMFGFMIAQQGSSPEQMHQYQTSAVKVMQENPNVKLCVSVTGLQGFIQSNQGILFAFLEPPEKRTPKNMPIDAVAGQLSGTIIGRTPGLLAFMIPQAVLQVSTGAASRSQGTFSYAVSGVDPKEVYATADKLLYAFYAKMGTIFIPGSGVSNDLSNQPAYNSPNLQIDIMRDQAASYGISSTRILNLLRNAYSQNYVYLIKKPNDEYQVILEAKDSARTDPQNLSLLYITTDDGTKTVPLSTVARWVPTLGPQSVNHLNQFTSVTFSFNLMPGVPLGVATDYIDQVSKQIVPSTMRADFQGDALTFRSTVSNLTVLMVLAVFVMYVILGILYESYLHPVTVLSSLPVALVGGLGTLVLFHQEASLYAYIGMFMLMGIVKKNGIMIVDFALQRISEGQTAERAIHDASMDRFRPIIMTTLAAVMGALPIALGFGADGEGRRPLGLVIIGGLLVSQFITLYVTPAIYLYLEMFQEKVLDRTSFFRSTRTHHEELDALDRMMHEGEGNGNGNGDKPHPVLAAEE
jgi:hydrophobic/amphiphilic exporter-1 (mainly G- bacteria), HAE1 family